MNTINERIDLLMSYYNLNTNLFSVRIGMKNNSIIGKIMNDTTRKPSYPTIVKILQSFPKVSCEWLVMGTGKMFGDLEDNIINVEDRIAFLMRKLNYTPEDFAVKIRVSMDELNAILSRSKKPSLKLLAKIASVFPQIDPSWLFVNDGRMFKDID